MRGGLWDGKSPANTGRAETFPMTLLSTTILGTVYETETADLPTASVEFLLNYGYRQYLADGAAVAKLDKDGNVRDKDEITDLKTTGVERRFDNVKVGSFPAGGGIRDPLASEIRRVTWKLLKSAAKAQNRKLPTDKDERREMFERFGARNADRIVTLATDNLARAKELGAIDATLD